MTGRGGDLEGRAEWSSREASRETADWLAEGGKLLEDGFPLQILTGWPAEGRSSLGMASPCGSLLRGCWTGEEAGGCRLPGRHETAGPAGWKIRQTGRWLIRTYLPAVAEGCRAG